MYNSVFLDSFGSNIFDTLGALESLKKELSSSVIWNSCGNSSIIIYFKILGFNFQQTLNYIKDFELVHTFINGFSIIPENADDKKEAIENWLKETMSINNLFNENSILEEIFKLTNIFPNFIVWSRKDRKLISINPTTFPKMRLIDAMLSTLTQFNSFYEFTVDDQVFSSYISGSYFPINKQFVIEGKKINPLYLTNYSNFLKSPRDESSAFNEIEEELMTQFLETHNSVIENLSVDNIVIVYSDIFKNSFHNKIKDFCYSNGKEQGKNFLRGSDNLKYYKERKLDIKNQN